MSASVLGPRGGSGGINEGVTERLGPMSFCDTHSQPTSSLGALSSHTRPSLSPTCPSPHPAALTSQKGKVGMMLFWTPAGPQRDNPQPWPPGPG